MPFLSYFSIGDRLQQWGIRTVLWSSLAILLPACQLPGQSTTDEKEFLPHIQGEEKATLTSAPDVPPPITRKHATKVIVELETRELIGKLADDVEYTFWTFGGDVPGSFIRVREGDLVEFHLHNHPDSKMPHNIDLHAVNGPGGGAESTFSAPGQTSVFSFRVLNPGLYVYHCAVAPVGMHIANGMYGLILVEPKEGMPEVDREYYIMQSEFYTQGAWGDTGLQDFDMNEALSENPDYVVFNGQVGSLVGDNAIQAEVGESVRLYVGNGGPNLVSSFHVIGEIFDKVYYEGGEQFQTNVQTTLIPAGGSAMVEFRLDTSGTYVIVDHSIFRAFNKGALGMLKVGGEEDKDVYSGKLLEQVYLPEGGTAQDVKTKKPDEDLTEQTLKEKMITGKRVYGQVCAACHQATGEGLGAAFPPLAGSNYLMEDKLRAIDAVVHGLSGPITVNGKKFNGVMPALQLNDREVAAVITYIRNSWGNKDGEATLEDVQKVRGK